MEWLQTPTAAGTYGEHWTLLAHQYIAARLNVGAGAAPSSEVSDALDRAAELLEACAAVPDPGEASALATTLDEFNNGRLGTDHCGSGDGGGEDTDGGDDTGGADDGGPNIRGIGTGSDTDGGVEGGGPVPPPVG